MADETCVTVDRDVDIVTARQVARNLAVEAGFRGSDLTLIATAISEIARNMVIYADGGQVRMALASKNGRMGIEMVAADRGPGIPDIGQAMQDGFSTGRSLGLGLPGARRLMDEFEIISEVGQGTTVTMRKWLP